MRPAASGPTVTVAPAALTSLPRIVTASGSVTAWEEVPVGAETGGLVATAVYVDEGTYVRQGQPLVQLNDALLRAQLRQQQAGVQTAEANLPRDEAALARSQELKERGFLSQASLDTALANQRAATANLASARASLSETQTRLSQATLRAPVAGLIISRSVTRGQIVQAGTEMFRMVRDGRLELDAQVPETELALVRAGQSATISSDQIGQTTGRVRIVTPEVDAARPARHGPHRPVGLWRLPPRHVRQGRDRRRRPARRSPCPRPPSCTARTGRACIVLMTNNHVRFQPVTVLSRSEARTSVTGLNAGALVVVDGAGFLGDGDRVNVVAARAAAAAAPAAAAPAAR